MTNGNDKAFGDRTISTTVVEGKTESIVMPDGLTKREYFAAMAMQGLLAGFVERSLANEEADCSISVADDAVLMADALIEALNTEEKHDNG